MLRLKRSRTWLLFAVVCAVSMLSNAHAAPLGAFRQYRVPTANSAPRHITVGSDGNLWFTEGNEVFTPEFETFSNIGRITPGGTITEFRVDCFCFLNDIVQGPGDVLYFTHNNSGLGRIMTAGEVLLDVAPARSDTAPAAAIGNGIAAAGDDVWFTDFNNNSIWRYHVLSDEFTQFIVPTPGANPYDVAVDAQGIVWFTEFHAAQIGRLDPQSGTMTEIAVQGGPREIAIATDGRVWFTERFEHVVGRLDPSSSVVTMFPLTLGAGPEDIAAAPNGALWFTQSSAGNIARITADGVVTEGKTVRGSEPFGIAIGPDGQSVWYAMSAANKIAVLTPR